MTRMARHFRRIAQTAPAALCLLALTGCIGGDDGGGGDTPRTGTFLSMGIENVHYETRSQSGTTNDEGEYRYYPDETLTLRVGDLVVAENVPAAPFVSPIDFTAEAQQKLSRGGTDRYGLQTHRVIEESLAANDREAINITRLLMVLSEGDSSDPSDTLTITQRTIDQVNQFLRDDSTPSIDFDIPVEEFERPGTEGDQSRNDAGDLRPDISSPANLLLDSICFREADSDFCDTPPTRTEINNAVGEEETQELEQERSAILEARRTLQDVTVNAVTEFLKRETLIFKSDLESPFYLSPETLSVSASDTSIQEVSIKRTGSSDFELDALEARVEGQDWYLDSTVWQTGTVRFYHDGPAVESGTVVINFRVDYPEFDNYRWFQKTLRVKVDDVN